MAKDDSDNELRNPSISLSGVGAIAPGEGRTRDFHKRHADAFANFYLTQISIIQAVAFGAFCVSVLNPQAGFFAHPFRNVCYSVVTFGVIVAITHEYSWFAALYDGWTASVLDVALPMALGLMETGAAVYVLQPNIWWIFVALTSLVGGLAYVYSLYTMKGVSVGLRVDGMLSRHYKFHIAFCLLGAACTAGLGLLAILRGWNYILPLLPILFLAAYVLGSALYVLEEVRMLAGKESGIPFLHSTAARLQRTERSLRRWLLTW